MQIQKFKETELGEIPEEWTIKTIGNMLKDEIILGIQDGNHGELYPRKKDFSTKGRIFLNANSITDDGNLIINNSLRLSEEYCKKLRIGFARGGDVLFTHNATVGRVTILPESFEDAIIGTSITYYRLNTKLIDKKYFAHYLKSPFFKNQLNKVMFQTTRKQVPITTQAKLSIVIPKVSEQQKIGSILSNVDILIQKTDQIIEQTQRLKKGLMQKLLTKGIGHSKFKRTEWGEIPEEWKIETLSKISKKIIDMEHKMPKKIKEGIPFISVAYLTKDPSPLLTIRKYDDFLEFISHEEFAYHSKRFNVEYGDLLISRYGTIGVTKLIHTEDKFLASYSIALIKPIKSVIDSMFLVYLLNSEVVKKQIRLLITQSSNTNLGVLDIKKIIICVPNMIEQQKIATILSNVDNLIQKLKVKRKNEVNLKKGLMQQLLTGKIRVKV